MAQEKNYRYPGPRPFRDNDIDRGLFFGREHEKQYLFHSILVENLFVLFAKSGMGKTSLLNAGLMELLREKGLVPLKIRFNDPKKTPLNKIYTGTEWSVKKRNKKVKKEDRIDYEKGKKDSLWEFFKTVAFWTTKNKRLVPVLILDQFEDFFTKHSQKNRKAFITQLADLVRGRVPGSLRKVFKSKGYFPYRETPPKVKVIISIRDDYLGYLEEMTQAIPNILQNRFRLMPLTRKQAREAIEKPASFSDENQFKTKVFSYNSGAVDAMLDFFCTQKVRDKIIKTNEIEPFQLQWLCQDIEKKVYEKYPENESKYIVQEKDLGGEEGMNEVLRGFYDNQIKSVGSWWKQIKVRKLCETGLIDIKGRTSLDEIYIKRRFKVPGSLLTDLVNNHLLRSEPRVGGKIFYELIHDTLVEPIKKSRKNRKVKKVKIAAPIYLTYFDTPWCFNPIHSKSGKY